MDYDTARCLLLDPPMELTKGSTMVFVMEKSGKTSAVIEKAADLLTPEDMKNNWAKVEAAIRSEVKSFVDLKTFIKELKSTARNTMTSKWVLR